MFRADLHTHTTYSDGSMTPLELLQLAKKSGISAISITDHDTISAYSEAVTLAEDIGIILGAGVEFSAFDDASSVHVLGYDFSLSNEDLKQFCERRQGARDIRNNSILDLLEKRGFHLNKEKLKSYPGTIGRPHIASLLLDGGYVNSFQEAFDCYLGDGRSCYVPAASVSVEETISIIHKANGKAFLAHPHQFRSPNRVKKLLEYPFDGLECFYSIRSVSEERYWQKMAKEKNLLISGGSDFHGSIKPHIPLGSSWIDKEQFLKIFNVPL